MWPIAADSTSWHGLVVNGTGICHAAQRPSLASCVRNLSEGTVFLGGKISPKGALNERCFTLY